jgi:hypothetical protein
VLTLCPRTRCPRRATEEQKTYEQKEFERREQQKRDDYKDNYELETQRMEAELKVHSCFEFVPPFFPINLSSWAFPFLQILKFLFQNHSIGDIF